MKEKYKINQSICGVPFEYPPSDLAQGLESSNHLLRPKVFTGEASAINPWHYKDLNYAHKTEEVTLELTHFDKPLEVVLQ
jgi:hypothetical protein